MQCIIEINDWNFALANYIVSWIWDLNYIWLIVVDGLLLPNVDLFLNDLNYLNAYHFDHMFLITNSTSLESSIFTALHTVTILFYLQSSYNLSLLEMGSLVNLEICKIILATNHTSGQNTLNHFKKSYRSGQNNFEHFK